MAGALVCALGGCTPGESRPSQPAQSSSTPASGELRADRPVVRLAYDVAGDHRSVRGVETVRFTPGTRVCGPLRFRAWPNKPSIARYGGSLRVRKVRVDGHAATFRVKSKG